MSEDTARPPIAAGRTEPRQVARAAAKSGITDDDIATLLGYGDGIYSLFWRKLSGASRQATPRDGITAALTTHAVYEWAGTWPGACPACVRHGVMMQSGLRAWQVAAPAALAWPHDPAGCDADTAQDRPAATVAVFTAPDDDEAWAAGPTREARARVLWQMDTADVSTGHALVLFLPSGELRSYQVSHDATLTGQLAAEPDPCDVCEDIMELRGMAGTFSMRVAEMNPPAPEGPPDADLAALRARWPEPAAALEADITPELWEQFLAHRDAVARTSALLAETEALIRAETGPARILAVGGKKVAIRLVYDTPVKAGTWTKDFIRTNRVPHRG
jgi:hypothetical protein